MRALSAQSTSKKLSLKDMWGHLWNAADTLLRLTKSILGSNSAADFDNTFGLVEFEAPGTQALKLFLRVLDVCLAYVSTLDQDGTFIVMISQECARAQWTKKKLLVKLPCNQYHQS